MVQFSAIDKASGKLNSYTAFPSVSIQNKVTSNNTVTDSTLGSYTFIKAPHVAENKLNSYTAFPSVSSQNKVASNNTVTDSTLESNTFIKAPHVAENNRKDIIL